MRKASRCVFCEIAAGKARAHIVQEDELSMCILDINPFAEGHCLVISKRHVPWWHDLTEPETESLFKMARSVAKRILKQFKPDFVCMYARGRRIPHTHLFLVPTLKGDILDRFFNALEGFQEAPAQLVSMRRQEALRKTAKQLLNCL